MKPVLIVIRLFLLGYAFWDVSRLGMYKSPSWRMEAVLAYVAVLAGFTTI